MSHKVQSMAVVLDDRLGPVISDHMATTALIGKHIQQNSSLTAVQWNLLMQSSVSLRMFLDEWERKNG